MKKLYVIMVVALMAGLAGCEKGQKDTGQAPVATGLPLDQAVAPKPGVGSPTLTTASDFNQEQLNQVGARLKEKYPKLDITWVGAVPGLTQKMFEFEASGVIGYTDELATFVFIGGELVAEKNGQPTNFTRERKEQRISKLLNSLPLDKALKYVFGKGERRLVIFSDPDCSFCQDFELTIRNWGEEANLSLFVLPMPLADIHPEARAKAEHIWCTANPEKTWHDWMVGAGIGDNDEQIWQAVMKRYPKIKDCDQSAVIDETLAVAGALGLSHTPTLLFENGEILNGIATPEELERIFAYVKTGQMPSSEAGSPTIAPNQ